MKRTKRNMIETNVDGDNVYDNNSDNNKTQKQNDSTREAKMNT